MNLYRFYIYVIGLSPFIFVAIVRSDFWGVIGLGYKLNRAQKRLYAKWCAWNFTRKKFNQKFKPLWETYIKNDKYLQHRREAYRYLKRDMWEHLYREAFEIYLAEFEKDKHDMELEYEDRQRRGL